MHINKTLLFILCSALGLTSAAQDTVYFKTGNFFPVIIRDNQPDFIEYRLLDEFSKENFFVKKNILLAIKSKEGFVEEILHDSSATFHSAYYFIENNGDTIREDPNYNPAASYPTDTLIKLKKFTDNRFYTKTYSDLPHFYINDSASKFLNSNSVIFMGVNFSFMTLVNPHDKPKAPLIKVQHLSEVAININGNKDLITYRKTFFPGKNTWLDTKASTVSYKTLQSMSWVSVNDYVLPAGKIPAIIKSFNFEQKEGTGVIFIVEKLSKPQTTVSGYWVAFDFATHKTLLIDYIKFTQVELQMNNFRFYSIGWHTYWGAGLMAAGVYQPVSFQKYLQLEKKDQLQLTD